MRSVGLVLAAISLAVTSPNVLAADLVVFSAAAMKSPLSDLSSQFSATTADHIRFIFGTAGFVRDKVNAGEAFDIVILPPAPLSELASRKFIVEGSVTPLGLVRLGAAVKAGARHPQLATPDDFEQAVLQAASVGLADPNTGATSGIYLVKLLGQIGLGDALQGKLKFYPEGQVAMEGVSRGEAALGLGQISEILPVQGVDLLGPLPESLQLKTIYSGGLGAASHETGAASRFLSYLSSPEAAAVFKKQGFEAPPAP